MVKMVSTTKKRWNLLPEMKVAEDLGYSKAELQILFNRGIISESDLKNKDIIDKKIHDFLEPGYESSLHDPFLLKDMDRAVERIQKALRDKEKICIYGDYDVDGVTSTALLSDTFEKLGADFIAYIPSRQDEGYGLNKEAIDEIARKGIKLIVTVDCGIRSFDEIEYANSLKLDVVVTDHHELEKSKDKDLLPKAVAVINPKRSDCDYLFKDLAGVGVAFKLACAVLSKVPNLANSWERWLLDLVALGTVCDVVPLVDENRVLVKYGLKVIAKTKRVGLQELIKSAAIQIEKINSHNLGFHLGPRLNASGRLENARLSLGLLLAKDTKEAEIAALNLSKINKERQDITKRILEEARAMLGKIDDGRNIILLKNKNWPAGVVGIVASRLMDDCGKPVLLFEEGETESKGSARSIDNFSIISALEKCEDVLVKYGGHKKAAGLTVKNEHFIVLNEKLIEIAGKDIAEEDLIPEIIIDAKIDIENIDVTVGEYIKKLEPFGFENKKPVFIIENAEVKNSALVGSDKNHLKLTIASGSSSLSGIMFGYGTNNDLKSGDKIDIVFTINENEWNGRVSLEAMILDIKKI
ncbi:single-stranded-DNA-specific exonuclease RecJ [bacterium (Candidatus Howlettbacteria) CG_4_10_14_0_8_um_filter_40_9]|nr:MAG: single-stranded-DNA-specific exonuclease RecJ [bacterium (Candidatus Howlettbacteria) CG_4_10_14_0_8_um_filter_40_9]